MSFVGMDVADVDAIVTQLDVRARGVELVLGVVDGVVGTLLGGVWAGADVLDFHGCWAGQHRPRVDAAHSGLTGMVAQLRREVNEQLGASGELAGGPGGGGNGPAPLLDRNILKFAEAANGKPDSTSGLPQGWSPVTGDALTKLGIDPDSIDGKNGTALNARIFTDGRGHYVLAFGGSQGDPLQPWRSDSVDWSQDDASAADNLLSIDTSQQAQRAADVAYQLKLAVGADHMEITGHSLGGRDAAVAAIATGAKAVTFNAAGPTDGGYLIAAVWDSKESADSFVKDVLLASLPVEGGFEGHPEERTCEIANLQTQ